MVDPLCAVAVVMAGRGAVGARQQEEAAKHPVEVEPPYAVAAAKALPGDEAARAAAGPRG
ncbi:MAG: hypothetical protein AB1585_09405 [Thermodesulfobacteriota bacterium]